MHACSAWKDIRSLLCVAGAKRYLTWLDLTAVVDSSGSSVVGSMSTMNYMISSVCVLSAVS